MTLLLYVAMSINQSINLSINQFINVNTWDGVSPIIRARDSCIKRMSRRYCCFRSILCRSLYLVPLPIHKILRQNYKGKKRVSLESTDHNKFQSITILAICGNRRQQQFQCLNTVLNIKTGQLFCGI